MNALHLRRLTDALARGEGGSIDPVLKAIEAGEAKLWTAERSAAVTQVVTSRIYHLHLAGGDLDELRALCREAEREAITLGCDAMLAAGRLGWSRALAAQGFHPATFKGLT